MDVTVDLDEIINQVKPWGLTLKLDGVTLRVRRLSNLDIKRLADARHFSDAQNRVFIAGLFESDEPTGVAQWDAERISAVIGAIGAYYQEAVIRPNLEAATTAVAGQVSKAPTGLYR